MSRAKLNRSRPADTVEEILAKAGDALRARRRPFNEADGLRRGLGRGVRSVVMTPVIAVTTSVFLPVLGGCDH